ncbi:hypothetical protein KM043_006485 [Ampulex compressa]|nr:hypothetical protein KM043_006485 [Ampulex compressa]
MGTTASWIALLQLAIAFVRGYHHAAEFDGWYQPVPQRPVDIITDVINDLGVRILQQYTDQGNVAISPTGVGFVLAALYEGSTGRGSQQISDALGLPRNPDITRIGFRDIHRRLRSYLNADGFLGGLTLNKENTILRAEYEDILRFYGFDLSAMDERTNDTSSAMPEAQTSADTGADQSMTEVPAASSTDGTATPATTVQLINAQDSSSGTEVPTTLSASTASPVEVLGMTLNTANLQDRLTQTTTAYSSTNLADAPTGSTPPTAMSTTNSETAQRVTTLSGRLPVSQTFTAPTTLPLDSGATSPRESTTTRVSAETSGVPPSTSTAFSTTMDDALSRTTVLDGSTSLGVTTTGSTSLVSSLETTEPATTMSSPPTVSQTSPTSTTLANIPSESSTTSNRGAMTMDNNLATSNAPPSTTSPEFTDASTPNPLGSSTRVDDAATRTVALTEAALVTDANNPGPKSTTTQIGGGITTTIVRETTTILSSGASMDEGSINVTQSSTAPSVDSTGESALTGGPPAAGNTVSTDLSSDEMAGTTEIGSAPATSATSMETGATSVDEERPSDSPPAANDDSTNRIRKRSPRSPRGYFSSYPDEGIWMQDLGIWKPYASTASEASVRDSTEISFLVNGCDVSSVSAARYIAVLPFAYFPSLHAVALEFPLDDPRYNILLLMSTDRRDTYRLAKDLGGKSLRLLRKQLQPTWVRATIPSFMLRGFVTLTSFLQRLGIVDVFEPRFADLSPMTPEPGVYVRDVQQSIGVNIRNYMKPDRTHSRNGLFERAGPVPFTALHPFLYFIIDTETSVALIAGRVNDPLNSRIL